MKLIHIINSSIFIVLLALICKQAEARITDQAKITIKVIDEQGKTVENANVRIGFEIGTLNGVKYNDFEGYTKPDGIFSGSASCNSHVGFTITKSGYYESGGSYDFINKSTFRWEPWNPEITVVLRKIESPVPMYARYTKESRMEIPVTDKEVGFDLIAFDWVKPYGKGSHSDFIFKLNKRFVAWNDQDSNLIITFSNKYDGVQLIENEFKDSILSLPKLAYDSGYRNKLNLYIKAGNHGNAKNYETNVKKSDNYLFRIRSEEKNGKFVRGLYGKIVGKIDFSTVNSKTATIIFRYYLNPDYTRNLEFDPKSNLFLNLSERERVRIK